MYLLLFIILLVVLIVLLFVQQPMFGRLPSGERLERIKDLYTIKTGLFKTCTIHQR